MIEIEMLKRFEFTIGVPILKKKLYLNKLEKLNKVSHFFLSLSIFFNNFEIIHL